PAACRTLAQWLLYVGLVLTAVMLMILGRANGQIMERMRIQVVDVLAPIIDMMSLPVDAVVVAAQTIRAWTALSEDNAALKHDRERLLAWKDVALRLEAENAQLRELVHLVFEPQTRAVSARVVADSGGAFARSLIVSAGRRHGVGKGHAVLTGTGLVGRVAAAAPRSSQVLLVSDLNFRAPVAIGPMRIRGIVAGDNSDQPKITHVDPDAMIEIGDRVVTSGDGEAFPSDLPVGTVATIDDGVIRVRLFTDESPVEYVQIVDFGLQGIIDEARIAGSPAPESAPAAAAGPAAP
ncbi:MAG: rod shape-determining protein MreC, partial [Rhodospirillales bacterium]|nr:rod shape-determining protein MreC [Rhodospirillales bacterium]